MKKLSALILMLGAMEVCLLFLIALTISQTTWMHVVKTDRTGSVYVVFKSRGFVDYLSGGGRVVLQIRAEGKTSEYPIDYHFENPYEARISVSELSDGRYRVSEARTGTILDIDKSMTVTKSSITK